MTTQAPRVTVCIPVYNGEAYVGEALDSVLSQTYQDFRVVVVDNCSTDGTADVVKGVRDSRLTYARNPRNLGLVGNANRCIELADGEYVAILHHDDVMFPENLERKVRVLDAHPGVGFVHSNVLLTDGQGKVLGEWQEELRHDALEAGRTVFERLVTHMPGGCRVFIGAVLARRACYERLGGFRPELPYTSDSEMWMRLALFYDVACLGQPLVTWRRHATSTTTTTFQEVIPFLEEHHRACKIIFSEYGERIADRSPLRRKVLAAFSDCALAEGWDTFYHGDLRSTWVYLRAALRLDTAVLRRRRFWSLAIRAGSGAPGARLYHALRRAVGKEL